MRTLEAVGLRWPRSAHLKRVESALSLFGSLRLKERKNVFDTSEPKANQSEILGKVTVQSNFSGNVRVGQAWELDTRSEGIEGIITVSKAEVSAKEVNLRLNKILRSDTFYVFIINRLGMWILAFTWACYPRSNPLTSEFIFWFHACQACGSQSSSPIAKQSIEAQLNVVAVYYSLHSL